MASNALARAAATEGALIAGPALQLISDLTDFRRNFIVHAATDNHNAPLICRGDVVIVDIGSAYVMGGCRPAEGALFLIEYSMPPVGGERYIRRTRNIVQTFKDHRDRWCAGGMRRGVNGREVVFEDGPYHDELALADKLIGKVIGLYRSAPEIGGDA